MNEAQEPLTFADFVAEVEIDDSSFESSESDNENADRTKTILTELISTPPSTAPGSLVVSREVWEVVRLSDSIIREEVEHQIEKLLEAVDTLRSKEVPLPDDMYIVQSLLVNSSRCMRSSRRAAEANEEQNRLWYRYHMFKNYEAAVDILQSSLRPVAATWHSARRAAILRRYGSEVTKLMRDEPLTPVCMMLIVFSHIWVALHLEVLQHHIFGERMNTGDSNAVALTSCVDAAFAFVVAALLGGFFAFGFQALDHELSHCTSLIPTWIAGETRSSRVNATFCHALGVLGSACTAVPWFSYYFSGGHERHHKLAGTPKDIDREAFFWAWERTPKWIPDTPMGSVVWASIVGIGLPVMYVMSLLICLLGNWRSNVVELGYFAVDSVATTAVHLFVLWKGGWTGLLYLVLSMAFGNGFLMHPLISFWLMQHLCHASPVPLPADGAGANVRQSQPSASNLVSMQPTVSYNGSPLWNLLNFNQLSHVEHHDFSRIPWTKAPLLRKAAPEFYAAASETTTSSRTDLRYISSVRSLIWHWIFTKGDKMNFACILAKAPPLETETSAFCASKTAAPKDKSS